MRNPRKRSRDETSQPPSPNGQKSRKKLSDVSNLPDQLAELVSDTCRLAASKPAAHKLVKSSMQKLYTEVQELCDSEGDVSRTKEGSESEPENAGDFNGWFVDNMETRNCFVSSPSQAAGIAYLVQVCKETGSPQNVYAPVKNPGMLSPRQVQMIEAVKLKQETGSMELGDGNETFSTVVDLESPSFAEFLKPFQRHNTTEQEQETYWTEEGETSVKESRLELPGDITGDDIELFCGKKQSWRAANVMGEEDGKIHVLGYHDGGVERVKLESRLWRPMN